MKPPVPLSTKWPFRIAVADLLATFERTILDILVVTSILTLVLVLWGLRSGVVAGFATDQLNTPESTRIFVVPRSPIRFEHLEYLEQRPEVGFVAPNVGFVNERMEMAIAKDSQEAVLAQIIGSGAGDPYLEAKNIELGLFDVAIGNDLALALRLTVGDTVFLKVSFRSDEKPDFAQLKVVGVIDSSLWNERAAFVHKQLAAAMSIRAYAEPGRIVLNESKYAFGVTKDDEFDTIRLYARRLEDVSQVVEIVNSLGWRAESREVLIAERFALERVTRFVFLLIVFISSSVLVITFVLSISGRLIRLQNPLLTLEGHGMRSRDAELILVFQSSIIALVGWGGAVLISIFLATLTNIAIRKWFFQLGISGTACKITIFDVSCAGAVVFFIALIISKFGTRYLLNTNKFLTN